MGNLKQVSENNQERKVKVVLEARRIEPWSPRCYSLHQNSNIMMTEQVFRSDVYSIVKESTGSSDSL